MVEDLVVIETDVTAAKLKWLLHNFRHAPFTVAAIIIKLKPISEPKHLRTPKLKFSTFH